MEIEVRRHGSIGGASAQVVGIATHSQGSLAHQAGTAVAKVLNSHADITARTQPLGGSNVFIPKINQGQSEFGFSNAVEVQFAYSGIETFDGRANPNLRLVGVAFPLRTGIVTVADQGVDTVQDLAKLKGKRIASEYTSLKIIQNYIAGALATGGFSYDDFTPVPVSDFAKGMFALGQDQVDVTLISLGSGAGHKVNTQLRGRGGFRYVDLDNSPEAMERFWEFMPGADIVEVQPGKAFPGVVEPTKIIEINFFLVTDP